MESSINDSDVHFLTFIEALACRNKRGYSAFCRGETSSARFSDALLVNQRKRQALDNSQVLLTRL